MTIGIIIGVIVIILGFIIWKSRLMKNSHKLPQIVEIMEYDNPKNRPEQKILQKGHKLFLSRELGRTGGYHLFFTLDTNCKDLSQLKKIIISWSEWKSRMFSFNYYTSKDDVTIKNDKIKIDIGSFNNCPSSKNFLKRSVYSKFMEIDLLDYEPAFNDYSFENNRETQSVFMLYHSTDDLKKFKKGSHYIDS